MRRRARRRRTDATSRSDAAGKDATSRSDAAGKKGRAKMLALYVSIRNRIAELNEQENGATAVEYGLMVALIAIVIIAAVRLLGTNLSDLFNDIANAITGG